MPKNQSKSYAVYLYRIPKSWIHKRTARKSGKEFYSMSIPTTEADNGWGSIIVWEKESLKPHKNQDGSTDDRFYDVKIADDSHDSVRISIKSGDQWTDIEKAAGNIAKERREEQRAYAQKFHNEDNASEESQAQASNDSNDDNDSDSDETDYMSGFGVDENGNIITPEDMPF